VFVYENSVTEWLLKLDFDYSSAVVNTSAEWMRVCGDQDLYIHVRFPQICHFWVAVTGTIDIE
jgi:hypothetical protein